MNAGSSLTEQPSCFIAMPLSHPYLQYSELVYEPAAIQAGLQPRRGDSIFGAGGVMGQIVRELHRAELMIAEISVINANVYYEIGIAHAMRKPVILLTDDRPTVPFDLQTERCLAYDCTEPDWGEHLRQDLAQALTETLADKASAIPLAFRQVEHVDASSDLELLKIPELINEWMARLARSQPDVAGGPASDGRALEAGLRETAERMLAEGTPPDEVVQRLIRSGASKLWAKHIVRELGGSLL